MTEASLRPKHKWWGEEAVGCLRGGGGTEDNITETRRIT